MNQTSNQNIISNWSKINATRLIVSIVGVLLGLSGINHGFFEVLQGNTPINGLIIQAIGEKQQFWIGGTEEAFTIIPNFLLTGILAIVISIGIIVWLVGFIHKPKGSEIYLVLCIISFLVGAGIAQVLFFSLNYAVATRINRPLDWWEKKFSNPSKRKQLAKVWPISLVIGCLLLILALEISTFGFFPGITNPDLLLLICWSSLGLFMGFFCISFISGFAHDVERKTKFKQGKS